MVEMILNFVMKSILTTNYHSLYALECSHRSCVYE